MWDPPKGVNHTVAVLAMGVRQPRSGGYLNHRIARPMADPSGVRTPADIARGWQWAGARRIRRGWVVLFRGTRPTRALGQRTPSDTHGDSRYGGRSGASGRTVGTWSVATAGRGGMCGGRPPEKGSMSRDGAQAAGSFMSDAHVGSCATECPLPCPGGECLPLHGPFYDRWQDAASLPSN
jgi:hypothetical protein